MKRLTCTVQLVTVFHCASRGEIPRAMPATPTGAVPERVTTSLVTEKSTPPLVVMANGAAKGVNWETR